MACNFFSELCLFCIFYLTCCCCANTKCAATPEQYLHTHTHTHVVLMRKEHFANSNSTNWVRVSLGISLLLFNIPILSSSEYLLSDYFLVASSMDFIVKPTKENDQKKKMKKDREKERERASKWTLNRAPHFDGSHWSENFRLYRRNTSDTLHNNKYASSVFAALIKMNGLCVVLKCIKIQMRTKMFLFIYNIYTKDEM